MYDKCHHIWQEIWNSFRKDMNKSFANSSYWNCYRKLPASVIKLCSVMLPLFLLFSSRLCKHPTTILSSQNGAFFGLYLLILHRKCQTVTVVGDFELRSVFWYLLWKFLRFLYAEILQWKFIFYFVFLLFFPRDSQCLQSLSVTSFPLLQSAELPILGNVAKQLRFTLVSRRKARTAGSAASPLLATPSGQQNRTSRLRL